ncbi:hypothetical protein ACFSKW_29255 [Nonomuraea mangrovi]|uniref:Uncharacterized protein n=1 Tax=Nonomuraea mangrovi TaxID=2316207 RepID=A0ABW4T394_9ACTN
MSSHPISRESHQAPETPQEDGGVMALLERIGSVVVPIAVALYAVLYIGIEQMYGVFGVNPQQVGVDQAVLFGRMMSTLVLLLLIAAPLLGVESDGTYVLYDCDKVETFRRPMETTNLGRIELQPEREKGFTCGGLAK